MPRLDTHIQAIVPNMTGLRWTLIFVYCCSSNHTLPSSLIMRRALGYGYTKSGTFSLTCLPDTENMILDKAF